MSADAPIPQRPFDPAYALAVAYLEARRTRGRGKSRTHADLRLDGELAGLRTMAVNLGLVSTRSRMIALADDVLADNPIDAGPEWLHSTAAVLAGRLTRGA